jgi:hypothetical protein
MTTLSLPTVSLPTVSIPVPAAASVGARPVFAFREVRQARRDRVLRRVCGALAAVTALLAIVGAVTLLVR